MHCFYAPPSIIFPQSPTQISPRNNIFTPNNLEMADAIPGIARRPEKKGKDYLLAIGIDDYVHVRPKLDNAVKDVKDFVELMVDRFGFDYENIRPIHKNKQLTKEF
jgi:hypothetical protein